jgi:hypothetical protein
MNMSKGRTDRMRRAAPFLAWAVLCLGLTSMAEAQQFKVIAFYNGNFDLAHIAFDKEAIPWFTARAAELDFSFTATTNWSLLNTSNLQQYKVVMFLDDVPPASVRAAFQTYMQNGGGFMGFHVSAFNTNPASWDWYHNQFLGTGAFRNNTWGPTTAVLRVEDRTHPATMNLPATFTSAVSEWYSWTRDLRTNPNIRILASVDPSSFPLGTDPNQTWTSGYFPILWTNRNYRMIYANFGHDAMDYANNIPKSSTFASPTQNKFIMDSLMWLGGVTSPSPTPTPTPTPATVEVTPPAGGVSASTNDSNVPANTVDDNLNTRWSALGNPQWIQYDLGASRKVAHVKIAWYNGNTRRSTFDVQVGDTAVGPWTVVLSGRQSGGTSTALETYDFTDTNGRYVRIVGHGNTTNLWNSITETQIFAAQ